MGGWLKSRSGEKGKSFVMSSAAETGDQGYDGDVDEIPKLDETGEEDHCDEDDDGGIDEFLVFLEALDFRIGLPRPACFAELAFYLADET